MVELFISAGLMLGGEVCLDESRRCCGRQFDYYVISDINHDESFVWTKVDVCVKCRSEHKGHLHLSPEVVCVE
jgi:hypothetical protein